MLQRWLWTSPWPWLAVVIAFFCVPLFIGLDRTDLDNDEAIYSFAVETMLKDGDWLTPKSIPSDIDPFLEKPPLKFWITYVPMRLGWLPRNEFGLRFMDALMGALAFLYVFGIGRKLAGPLAGLVAVFLLFSHASLLFEHGLRSNNMESTTVLAYAGGVYHFIAWRSINPDTKRHVYAMALWFVFGFLTKFVAALFLPVVLGMSALLTRESIGRLYRDWRTFTAAALVAVVLILPWFLYQFARSGQDVLGVMFGMHVFKRLTVYLDPSHLHPWHHYLTSLWSKMESAGTHWLISIAAVAFVLQTMRRRWIEGAVVVLWFAVPIAAISAGTSKLYHYAYPFIAPLAIAGGWLVAMAASRLFAWIAGPVDALTARRDALLPASFTRPAVQPVLTIAGLTAALIAAATATFERLELSFGAVSLRNSSVMRPGLGAAVLLAMAAPREVLRALIVAGIVALTLPIQAYYDNVRHARETRNPMRTLRECLQPIVDRQVAAGLAAPGVWVETKSISWLPFYYLRGLGPWQQRDVMSDETVVMHLTSRAVHRPVVLASDRLEELVRRLETDETLIDRVARKALVDPAVISASLTQDSIGQFSYANDTFLLPGQFKGCGRRIVRLIER